MEEGLLGVLCGDSPYPLIPVSELVRLLETGGVIDEGYFYNSLAVAGIDFFCLPLFGAFKALDWNLLPSSLPGKIGVKRKADLVPGREVTRGLPLLVDMAAFQVTEMAHVVGWLIPA